VTITIARIVSKGLFPLDDQLHIREQHWSETVAQQAVWLYGHMEDDLAEQILQKIGGLAISDTSIWRRAQKWSEKIRVAEEVRAKTAVGLPQRGQLIRGQVPHERPMGIAMDAGKMNIRGTGWCDFKVGSVFDIVQRTELDPLTQEMVAQPHAVQNSYVAVLGGPVAFGSRVWAEAVRREFPEAVDSVVVGDGAPWIWNLASEHFSTSHQVVDWYHAKQHLYTVANSLFGEDTTESHAWVKQKETPLYQGHARPLADEFRGLAKTHHRSAKVLRREAGYFENHHRRMQYLETREEGFPIGSGMIESGIKQFRSRLVGPGMHWKRESADRILPLRAVILSNRFDQVWNSVYSPPN
jgi:hypothetical protein